MRVERFPSVEAYASTVEETQNRKSSGSSYDSYYGDSYSGASQGYSWDGGLGFRDAIRMSKEGDPTIVSKYVSTVDKLVNEYQFRNDNRTGYRPSVAGSRVSVQDYLAGSPTCMRRRVPQEMQNRSVSIYVSTTCAGGIPADKMMVRGATILSLLEFLQTSQVSVELFLLAETHGRTDGDLIQVIQVESHPLNLSTAGFAIAHPAFARRITYCHAYNIDGFNGQWGRSQSAYYSSGTGGTYAEKLSKAIGMGPSDIYVPAPKYDDGDIFVNPDKWLEERIVTIKDGMGIGDSR